MSICASSAYHAIYAQCAHAKVPTHMPRFAMFWLTVSSSSRNVGVLPAALAASRASSRLTVKTPLVVPAAEQQQATQYMQMRNAQRKHLPCSGMGLKVSADAVCQQRMHHKQQVLTHAGAELTAKRWPQVVHKHLCACNVLVHVLQKHKRT